MRNKDNKHLGIEIEPKLHYKFRYVADYDGRSGNREILYLIRRQIMPRSMKSSKHFQIMWMPMLLHLHFRNFVM